MKKQLKYSFICMFLLDIRPVKPLAENMKVILSYRLLSEV